MEKPNVVILCGGKGTRLREETGTKPKPMVTIGDMPILWHIMKIYSHYGFNDFVLCLGYKGEVIKDFFLHRNDFSLNTRTGEKTIYEYKDKDMQDWNITFAETGENAMTGARIKKAERYVDTDSFFATYGDAVCDVDIGKLASFHKKQNTVATLTAVHPHSKWGLVKSGDNGMIEKFVEKPVLYDFVNGGFFAFQKKLFDYLDTTDNCILEANPFSKLVLDKQFSMYKHEGFWHSMDTYKDYLDLDKLWNSGKVPWKKW
ncbi:NTP transferase domain-containing protein [Candidatus Micrarchaeota archaeon]|nr:NTP transferase domain-containing protein [Candidatus Micrarchaeota archaeon]